MHQRWHWTGFRVARMHMLTARTIAMDIREKRSPATSLYALPHFSANLLPSLLKNFRPWSPIQPSVVTTKGTKSARLSWHACKCFFIFSRSPNLIQFHLMQFKSIQHNSETKLKLQSPAIGCLLNSKSHPLGCWFREDLVDLQLEGFESDSNFSLDTFLRFYVLLEATTKEPLIRVPYSTKSQIDVLMLIRQIITLLNQGIKYYTLICL